MNETILLTGATGFVGRYVLRELLLHSDVEVMTLVRGNSRQHAQLRIADVLEWLGIDSDYHRRVKVCSDDLTSHGFGDSKEIRDCLHRCTTIVHAAANVSFTGDEGDEPARTNVFGTSQLLSHVGPQVQHWVQVSTAYVAPTRGEIGVEQDAKEFDFRNEYETTKAAAEKMVSELATARGFSHSIVRPGIVVGEYDTGRASIFQGFYQPLRAIERLANHARRDVAGKVRIPLRFNISSQEIRNLVPVDWVAQVIREIALRGQKASGIFHLTPECPTTNLDIFEAVSSRWNIDGMAFHPDLNDHEMTTFERAFYRQLTRIAPYWKGEPRFDNTLRKKLLPHLPCPSIDKVAIERLLGFAVETQWGEQPETVTATSQFPAADYLERFLPKYAPLSTLPRLTNVTAEVGFRISDSGGGEWRCHLDQGDVVSVHRSSCRSAAVVFETDGDTLQAIVAGELSPQKAFFDRRIEIAGDIEIGLKLAMIFGQFVNEFPYDLTRKGGLPHVAVA